MKKIFTLLLLTMSMLSLNAQTEKETVYIDFNPHIGRLENTIDEDGYIGLSIQNPEYTLVDDNYVPSGYIMSLYYKTDALYSKLTPDTKVHPYSQIGDLNTDNLISISNLNGEVKEVDGKTVFDFTCDGSDGKVYVIHAESYMPEPKEEVNMTFTNVYFRDYGSMFLMSGKCDNYNLVLYSSSNGDSYDGTFNFMNNEYANNTLLFQETPRSTQLILQLDYTVTTREDGYVDVRGDILTETAMLIHFYMTNAPESETNGISLTAGSDSIEQIYDLSGKKLGAMQKGMNVIKLKDGSVRKVMMK